MAPNRLDEERMDWRLDVLEFHAKMRAPIASGCTTEVLDRRLRFIEEEFREVRDAVLNCRRAVTLQGADLEQWERSMAQELVDLMYVVLGTFVELGIDPDPVWNAVHDANMAKDPAPDGGKARKGETWKAPAIELRALAHSPNDGSQR
jgi:hypothetical protein